MNQFRNIWFFFWSKKNHYIFAIFATFIILFIPWLFGVIFFIAGPIDNFSLANIWPSSENPFYPCYRRAFIAFVTLNSSEHCPVEGEILGDAIEYSVFIFSVLFFASIIAYFTASILSPRHFFKFKSKLNFIRKDEKDFIYLSVYNDSPSPISNLNVRIIARIRTAENTMKNCVLKDGSPTQPLAEPYIPLRFKGEFTDKGLYVTELDEAGVVRQMVYQPDSQSRPCIVEEIFVDVAGIVSSVEQGVYSSHRYFLEDDSVLYKSYYDKVSPDYNLARNGNWRVLRKPPVEIREKFEKDKESSELELNNSIYIFSYGSLVQKSSFERTLGRTLEDNDFIKATLHGYKKFWNVAMNNEKTIPGYRFYNKKESSERLKGYVTFLNIQQVELKNNDETDEIKMRGMVGRVTTNDLDKFDAREKNYNRINITSEIKGAPAGSIIYTYIGKQEALDRFTRGVNENKVFFSKSYAENIEQAYRDNDILEDCLTPPCDDALQGVELTSEPIPLQKN